MDIKQKRIDEINEKGLVVPINKTIGMQLTEAEKVRQENNRLKKRIEILEAKLEKYAGTRQQPPNSKFNIHNS